jgi:predicted amidohydrolase
MFKASCIQLKSNNNVKDNLKKTEFFIKKAVKQKTNFILTPEVSSLFSLNKKQLIKESTTMEKDYYCNGIKKLAKKYKKWILIGSIIVKKNKTKLFNRSVLINPKGFIKAYYDKIHLYDAKLGKKEFYYESKVFKAGKKLKTYKMPWGILGFSICYDLRFPNMYRKMSQKGSLFFSIPSAFTKTTGKKHWHALLRARAIENFCYIFAPAQGGTHYNKRKTYGHSLIVSPDGKIVKELKNKEGVITVKIDPNLSKKLRKKIPSLRKH